MDRREFIDKLQRALAGGLGSSLVAENVRYYEEYIDSEVRRGKSEVEVLSALGDPRLLAKSIIEANKRAGDNNGSNRNFDEEVSDDAGGWYRNRNASGGRLVMLPGWLVMLIITVVVIVVIGLVTSLLAVFAPVMIAVLLVLLVIKVFQSKK